MYKGDLPFNNLQRLICHKTRPNQIIFNMYKEDLALNNLQWLICHQTQPNPTKHTPPFVTRPWALSNKHCLVYVLSSFFWLNDSLQ